MLMNDWCPNGCQDLCGLGECGMCGYEGEGVNYWDTDYVIDADEENGGYIRVPNPDKAREHETYSRWNEDLGDEVVIGCNMGCCGPKPAEKPSTLAFLAGVAAGFLGL